MIGPQFSIIFPSTTWLPYTFYSHSAEATQKKKRKNGENMKFNIIKTLFIQKNDLFMLKSGIFQFILKRVF